MTESKSQAKQVYTIDDLYEILKPEIIEMVEGIESSIETTQNHYGRYMGAISSLNGSRIKKSVAAKLLIMGGANRSGVMSALRLS